jgi:hypothetical protein
MPQSHSAKALLTTSAKRTGSSRWKVFVSDGRLSGLEIVCENEPDDQSSSRHEF